MAELEDLKECRVKWCAPSLSSLARELLVVDGDVEQSLEISLTTLPRFGPLAAELLHRQGSSLSSDLIPW